MTRVGSGDRGEFESNPEKGPFGQATGDYWSGKQPPIDRNRGWRRDPDRNAVGIKVENRDRRLSTILLRI